jgi:hypothetical protein
MKPSPGVRSSYKDDREAGMLSLQGIEPINKDDGGGPSGSGTSLIADL